MDATEVLERIIPRMPVTTLTVDHIPEGFAPGAIVVLLDSGEEMTIVDIRPEDNEVDVLRTPRG